MYIFFTSKCTFLPQNVLFLPQMYFFTSKYMFLGKCFKVKNVYFVSFVSRETKYGINRVKIEFLFSWKSCSNLKLYFKIWVWVWYAGPQKQVFLFQGKDWFEKRLRSIDLPSISSTLNARIFCTIFLPKPKCY